MPSLQTNTKLRSWSMKALVTGATGWVGRRLLGHLEAPVVLCREPADAHRTLHCVEAHGWDAELGPPPIDALRGVDAVYHLAGEPVAPGRWTAEKKRRIRNSRVIGTGRQRMPWIHRKDAVGLLLHAGRSEVGEMLVASARALPRVSERTGHVFRYPQLEDALRGVVTCMAEKAREGRA